MKRSAVLTYGAVCYAIFFVTYLYAIGFIGNLGVPKSLDVGGEGTLGLALVVNGLLLGLFGIQHSVMARPGFKAWWTRIVPEPCERSTYVLLSSVAMILLYALWVPMGGVIWDVQAPAAKLVLQGLFLSGFVIVLYATFLIDHFDLFGLRQVWLYFRGREYTDHPFGTPGAYKYVRHPLYIGWLTAFWATPTMTVGHLYFAGICSAYIFVAIVFEERDLIAAFGERYREYRETTPMLVPGLGRTETRVPVAAQPIVIDPPKTIDAEERVRVRVGPAD